MRAWALVCSDCGWHGCPPYFESWRRLAAAQACLGVEEVTGEGVQFVRRELRLSPEELASGLGVEVEQLLHWESEGPSKLAVQALKGVLWSAVEEDPGPKPRNKLDPIYAEELEEENLRANLDSLATHWGLAAAEKPDKDPTRQVANVLAALADSRRSDLDWLKQRAGQSRAYLDSHGTDLSRRGEVETLARAIESCFGERPACKKEMWAMASKIVDRVASCLDLHCPRLRGEIGIPEGPELPSELKDRVEQALFEKIESSFDEHGLDTEEVTRLVVRELGAKPKDLFRFRAQQEARKAKRKAKLRGS